MEKKKEQTLQNMTAVLASLGAPEMEVEEVLEDRVFFIRTPEFDEWLKNSDAFASVLGGHQYRGEWAQATYRQKIPTYSMNLQVYERFVEADIDYYNPDLWNSDLRGIIGHLFEVTVNFFWKRKTDPFKVAKELRKRGVEC